MLITRENHDGFCTEPQLADSEWRRIWAMRHALQDDVALQKKIHDATTTERAALCATENVTTVDWSCAVVYSDAVRRLYRAQVEAFEDAEDLPWTLQHS